MMELAVLNTAGKETGRKVELMDSIFSIEPNDHAIYLEVKQYLANQRQGTACTKTRAEVSGSRSGGWRQRCSDEVSVRLQRYRSRDGGLAPARLVHALDEVKLFKFLKRAIDRDQPKGTVTFARHVEDFDRGEGALGSLNGLDNGAARTGDTVAIFLQLGQPEVRRHNDSY